MAAALGILRAERPLPAAEPSWWPRSEAARWHGQRTFNLGGVAPEAAGAGPVLFECLLSACAGNWPSRPSPDGGDGQLPGISPLRVGAAVDHTVSAQEETCRLGHPQLATPNSEALGAALHKTIISTMAFMQRLAALVPRLGLHLLRFSSRTWRADTDCTGFTDPRRIGVTTA